MAIDGANLINSNVVYDTSHSLNTYNKALQQQQLRAVQEQKALSDELGSIKSNGIRDADKPVFYNKFDEWRNTAVQASKERDPQKRMMMQGEADKRKMELANLVDQSKNYQKVRDQVNTHYIGKDPLDDFEEPGWNMWKQSANLPITDPNLVKDPSALQIRPDTDSFVKDLTSLNNQMLQSNGVYLNSQGKRVTSGNREGTVYDQVKAVKPEVQLSKYMAYLATNKKAYKAAQALYPDLAQQLPKDQFIQQVSTDLVAKNPIKKNDTPRYVWDNKPTKGSGDSTLIQVDNTAQSVPIQDKNITVQNVIRASPTAFNLGGVNAYDTKSDTHVKIPNIEGGVKLAQYGWYPFAKSATETTKNKITGKVTKKDIGGHLVQKDYAEQHKNDGTIEWKPMALVSYTDELGSRKVQRDLFVDVDNLPKDKKEIQKYVKALKANPPQQVQQKQPSESQPKQFVSKSGIKVTIE